jgi:glyoxylase-like metal-dependent hydrolase (beta-lactamase superfamily II)
VALALSGPAAGDATQLFTGDCLFPGGVGKTWQPGEFTQLLTDVTSRVFDRFGDDTVVYPGHGDDTTLGAERPHLGEWKERGW